MFSNYFDFVNYHVLLTGGSAGGRAAMYWSDWFYEKFDHSKTDFRTLSDSSFFIDVKSVITDTYLSRIELDMVSNISNHNFPHPNKGCAENYKDEIWRCFFMQYLTPFV